MRTILDEARLHPAIRDAVANHHADIVHNVQAASMSNPVLVVGMAQNPFCRKARRLLDAAGVPLPVPRVRQLPQPVAQAQCAEDVERLADLSDGVRQRHAGRRRVGDRPADRDGRAEAGSRRVAAAAPMRNRVGLLALAGLLAGSLAGGPARAAALTECRVEGIANSVQCGWLDRPLDPARAQGPQVRIHYVVVPAMARQKLADPVFLLAGGPGQSAIQLAPSVLPLAEPAQQPARPRLRRPARHRPLGAARVRGREARAAQRRVGPRAAGACR